ncbi:MAG TPA: YceI family protein [Candidatus Acidoferrales bacterium]|nr:YceI family protein [Candidatus Acidoferrales bacterium]
MGPSARIAVAFLITSAIAVSCSTPSATTTTASPAVSTATATVAPTPTPCTGATVLTGPAQASLPVGATPAPTLLPAVTANLTTVPITRIAIPPIVGKTASIDIMEIDQAAHVLYVTDRTDNGLDIFDVSTACAKYVKTIDLGSGTNGVVVAKNVNKVFTTTNDSMVAIIDISAPGSEKILTKINTDAVLTTDGVTGALTLLPDGTFTSDSQITVDMTKLKSDQELRDTWIHLFGIETNRFRTSTFTPKRAVGLPTPLPSTGSWPFTIEGDLTIHGVTKPMTWDATAQRSGPDLTANAKLTIQWADFGVGKPQAAVTQVVSVSDDIRLEIALVAKQR